MFNSLTYDATANTWLATLSGVVTVADLDAMRAAAVACREAYGLSNGILDFRAVVDVQISSEQRVARAQQPPVMMGRQRVIVADGAVYGVMRQYSTYQEVYGAPPLIVRTLDEAFKVLGISASEFKPTPL